MSEIQALFTGASSPLTALAPMQDITDRPFMELLAKKGAPDLYLTAYSRVHATSLPESEILDCIINNATGRPIIVQLLGESIPDLLRTIGLFSRYPIAGIDLNLGCPAPKVFRKNVGGGLLRDLPKVERIVMALREGFSGLFSIKTRLGFEHTRDYDALLDIFARARPDMVTIHGRTVRQLYRGTVDYDAIAHAARRLEKVPVLANGDITSAEKAQRVLADTGCAGVMIGRSAVRNPWIFRQLKETFSKKDVFQPTLADVHAYAHEIWEHLTGGSDTPDYARLGRLKKMLNFVGQSVDSAGEFLKHMRMAQTPGELFAVCQRFLGGEREKILFATEPYSGILARPNCEGVAQD